MRKGRRFSEVESRFGKRCRFELGLIGAFDLKFINLVKLR